MNADAIDDPIAKVIDQWTLEFMSNAAYNVPNIVGAAPFDRQEHKFYRKRMLALIKEQLSRGKYPTENLQRAYEHFAATLMLHLKTIDKHDLVQTARGTTALDAEADDVLADAAPAFDMVCATTEHLKRVEPVTSNTLDNFVIRHGGEPNDHTTKIIPLQLELNLQAENLKTKGIAPKKKKTRHAKEVNPKEIYTHAPTQIDTESTPH